MPVSVPANVNISLEKNHLVVKGPKGELTRDMHPSVSLEYKDNQITVSRKDDSKESRSIHGLSRALIANMVDDVSMVYAQKLHFEGVGDKVK